MFDPKQEVHVLHNEVEIHKNPCGLFGMAICEELQDADYVLRPTIIDEKIGYSYLIQAIEQEAQGNAPPDIN